MSSVGQFPLESPISEMVVPLFAGDGHGKPFASGTGVFIAPGIAFGASHVAEDFWKIYGGDTRPDRELDAVFGVQALQYQPALGRTITWHVDHVTIVPPLDVAVLSLTPSEPLPTNYRWPYPTIRLASPEIGEEVEAFGYVDSVVEFDSSVGAWNLDHTRKVSVGTVADVFPKRRDRVKLPFPSMQLEMEISPGMSGGPVFDHAGRLCGLSATGFDFLADDTGVPVGYASLLWPAMLMPFRAAQGNETLVIDLARAGRIRVEDHHLMRIPSTRAERRAWVSDHIDDTDAHDGPDA